MDQNAKSEEMALQVSLVGTLIIALIGIAIGLLLRSYAIFVDGLFSIFSMVMTALSLYTAKLVHRPDDDYFQFGYNHLEPLVTVIQGVALAGICIASAISGIVSIIGGGRLVDLGGSAVYAIIATLFCLAVYLIEMRMAKRANSQLVKVDAQAWLLDVYLSMGLLVGFGGAWLLQLLGVDAVAPYVDPLLITVISISALGTPLRHIYDNVREVLLITPDSRVKKRVQRQIEKLSREHGFADYSCHFVKSGRQYDLEINILVDDPKEWPIERQDLLRDVIDKTLVKKLGKTWLSVSFTAQKKWL